MNSEKQSPNYLGLYWGFIIPDLCRALRIRDTPRNKRKLHEEFKAYLKWPTISNNDDEQIRLFINRVLMVAAREKGIFIRTKSTQPEFIEDYPLGEVWEFL